MNQLATIIGEPSAAKGAVIAFGLAVGAVVYWRIDMGRHPKVPCRTCGGHPPRSTLRGDATGTCQTCRGSGTSRRRWW